MANFNQELIQELQQEAGNTRKLLMLVPMDKLDYSPHPKSMKMGPLAIHISELPGWITLGINNDGLDFATHKFAPFQPKTNEELAEHLDKNVASAVAALATASAEVLQKPWTLRSGEHLIFTLPKAQVVRSFAMNHMIHHRAQLGVYLRMLDIAIPGMYGPSADEK